MPRQQGWSSGGGDAGRGSWKALLPLGVPGSESGHCATSALLSGDTGCMRHGPGCPPCVDWVGAEGSAVGWTKSLGRFAHPSIE